LIKYSRRKTRTAILPQLIDRAKSQVSNAASSSTRTMVREDSVPRVACHRGWLARILVGFVAVDPDCSVVPVSL
jgi:hypothetical protein